MSQNKLKRFAELHAFPNVIEAGFEEVFSSNHPIKGKWLEDKFHNNHPIVIELGCGKGEYTFNLAEKFPNKNFIGVDIKGNRIWVGAKKVIEKGLKNAMFLRTRIEFITSFFAINEVDEIWITFPDPQENRTRRRNRLTSSVFLKRYKSFLKPNAIIHLKTDNDKLFDYTLRLAQTNQFKIYLSTFDLYNSNQAELTHSIKTYYENIFLAEGKPIHYLQFSLNNSETIDEPEE